MRIISLGNLYPPAALGGYERMWLAAVGALRAAGHDVRVLTTAGSADGVASRELAWYWRDYDFPDRSPLGRLRLERHNARVLARHLRELRPDAVCWFGMGGMSLSLVEQVRRAGIPAVGVVADAWMAYGFEVDGWMRAWARRPRAARVAERLCGIPTRVDLAGAAHWLFASRWLLDDVGLPLARAGFAHPGVDPARFASVPARPWSWRLACIGRVEPTKGVATAIEALALLPAARLDVVGDGPPDHLAALRALSQRLGVAERVRFGRVEIADAAAAYAAADAVLFPVTWEEPWGLVPLEAMSVGRPVVATGTGGSAEYLRDGANALLFARGDAAALEAAAGRGTGAPVAIAA